MLLKKTEIQKLKSKKLVLTVLMLSALVPTNSLAMMRPIMRTIGTRRMVPAGTRSMARSSNSLMSSPHQKIALLDQMAQKIEQERAERWEVVLSKKTSCEIELKKLWRAERLAEAFRAEIENVRTAKQEAAYNCSAHQLKTVALELEQEKKELEQKSQDFGPLSLPESEKLLSLGIQITVLRDQADALIAHFRKNS